jgi:hypothetical protein
MYFIRIAPDYHAQFWVTTSAAPPLKLYFIWFFQCPPWCLAGTCNRRCNPSVRWNHLATGPAMGAWSWSLEMIDDKMLHCGTNPGG